MVSPAKASKARPAYAITSVDHALRLAAQLQLEGRLTVSEAAARLEVAPSTAHRLLSMLVYRDFATKEGREYRVGPVLSLASQSHSTTARLREAALPAMRHVVGLFDETATLMIRSGPTSRFIAEVESTQSLRVGNRTGMVFPAYRTSGGLALLAELEDGEIAALYDPARLEPQDEVPDMDAVLKHVRAAREQGFALNQGLSERGVLGIGHTVRAPDGEPLAAIGLAMPSARFEPALLRPIVAALRHAVREVERALADAGATAGSSA